MLTKKIGLFSLLAVSLSPWSPALGQGCDQYAGDPGSLLGSVGADRLLKSYLQLGPDRDRLGQGIESCKCQRGEAALEKDFTALKTHRTRTPAEREPTVMNNYSPHEASIKTQVWLDGGTPSVYRGPPYSMPSSEKFWLFHRFDEWLKPSAKGFLVH